MGSDVAAFFDANFIRNADGVTKSEVLENLWKASGHLKSWTEAKAVLKQSFCCKTHQVQLDSANMAKRTSALWWHGFVAKEGVTVDGKPVLLLPVFGPKDLVGRTASVIRSE